MDDEPPSSSSSYLGPAQLSPEQTAEVDETVALRLARLTAAFAAVDDALRYQPGTLARLATALTALEVRWEMYLFPFFAMRPPLLTHSSPFLTCTQALSPPLVKNHATLCARLQRLETKVTAELVSDRARRRGRRAGGGPVKHAKPL